MGTLDKHREEMNYWKYQYETNHFNNSWYSYFFTKNFNIDEQEYHNKKILDIGCGPQGSLEWISEKAQCFGLDPLANEYYHHFDCKYHKMNYVKAHSENIPFPDNYFDYVFSMNSLDHVDNVEKTLKEIVRVLTPKATFLLIVEVNHEERPCEPHNISHKYITQIEGLNLVTYNLYGSNPNNGLLSVQQKLPVTDEPRWFSGRFEKI